MNAFYSSRCIDSDKKSHVTLQNNMFYATFVLIFHIKDAMTTNYNLLLSLIYFLHEFYLCTSVLYTHILLIILVDDGKNYVIQLMAEMIH